MSEIDHETAGKVLKWVTYALCLLGFFVNSFAIFQTFASNTTIKSTRVVTAPGGLLEAPILLICNSTPYKEPILYTSLDAFKNNTMKRDDFIVDALVVENGAQGVLSYKPSSIKENVKEIATMFHGTCITIDSKIQVPGQYEYPYIQIKNYLFFKVLEILNPYIFNFSSSLTI